MHSKKQLLALTSLCVAMAGPVLGQSSRDTADIPQPHLAKARAAAFQGNTWNYPGLILCYSDQNTEAQQVIKLPPPTKAFDNLYNVGIGAVTAWAVTTSQGIILIDTLDNTEEAKTYIEGGLKKLGLNPADIKDIIITHGHADHYGGAAYLQQTYPHAHVYMTAVDYDLAEKAAAGPRGHGVAAPRRDQVVTDGEKLTLGDETITMYITPGHTPGTISMLVPVKDHGRPKLLSFWGGTASANLTPEMHKAYDQSVTRFSKISRDAHVDGFLSNHPSLDDSDGKLEHLRETPDMPNPFLVGLAATTRYYKVVQECNLNNADINAARAKAKPKSS